MGQILVGIKNFLDLINQNWTLITVIIGLGILVFKKVKSYLSLSEQEKIDLALEQIRITALKMVTDAEKEYDKWVKAGSIKRAEVIDKILSEHKFKNQIIKQLQNGGIFENNEGILDWFGMRCQSWSKSKNSIKIKKKISHLLI